MTYQPAPSAATVEQITTAARWLSEHWNVAPQPITRYLRESYGLAFNDAVKAMVEARRLHAEGGAK